MQLGLWEDQVDVALVGEGVVLGVTALLVQVKVRRVVGVLVVGTKERNGAASVMLEWALAPNRVGLLGASALLVMLTDGATVWLSGHGLSLFGAAIGRRS